MEWLPADITLIDKLRELIKKFKIRNTQPVDENLLAVCFFIVIFLEVFLQGLGFQNTVFGHPKAMLAQLML